MLSMYAIYLLHTDFTLNIVLDVLQNDCESPFNSQAHCLK